MKHTGYANSRIAAFYDDVVPGKVHGDYEFARWFRRALSRSE